MNDLKKHQTFHHNPGCLVQLLWFIFVGWWACQLWIGVAWFFMLLIIPFPLGAAMVNALPKVVALREPNRDLVLRVKNGVTTATTQDLLQHNFLLRAFYFFLIGWWFSALWVEVAYFFCVIILGMPIGFWMFDRMPAILTLRKQ